MKSLPVAFDHQIFTQQVHGGVSRYFVRLAEHLPECNVAPKVIAPLHVNAYLAEAENGVQAGIKLPLTPFTRRAAVAVDRLLHQPMAAAADAQIVHQTYYSTARIAARRAKVVITVYDMIHELYPEHFADRSTTAKKAAAVRRADHIFCISESTRRDLLRFFPDAADRSSVTLLGFDQPGGAPAGDQEARRPDEESYLLYVGERGGYKNFASLVEAYHASSKVSRNVRLICVGGGPFTPSERELIRSTRLEDRIERRDADDALLYALYRGAEAFVYPSVYEGFGIPPLEAMANDCPAIVCRSSSLPEVCNDAAEYFVAGSRDSLVAALENVVLSNSRATELRAAGRNNLKRFSWGTTAAATAAVYQDLA